MNIETIVKLRNEGRLEESRQLALALLKQHPEDAFINYQCAWCHDVMEMETKAVQFYEKAIGLGLPNEDLKEAYLGLGSTLRSIGAYDRSLKVYEVAIKKFDDNSLKVFYAMTLFNLKKHSESMDILLKIIAETSNDKTIMRYSKAISYYSDKLNTEF